MHAKNLNGTTSVSGNDTATTSNNNKSKMFPFV